MFHPDGKQAQVITLLLTTLVNTICIFGAFPCVPRDYNKGGTVCVCNATYCDTIDEEAPYTSDQYLLFISSKEGLRFNKTIASKINSSYDECQGYVYYATFKIDTSKTYQKMHGFGGAFTDAACINILSLSKGAQNNLLRSYFSKDGIKYNIGRVPIGGADFSTHPYTYDDGQPDPNLNNFNLTKEDITLKIPIILRAQSMSEREIQLFGSAWSSPTFMKTNKKISGFGFLEKKYYSAWADYHIKFLDGYKKYNISFWALTTGNEPINGIIPLVSFNSLGWTPWGHGEWIGHYLGPRLQQSQYNKTLLIGLDDQRYLLPWWMKWVFKNKEAAKYISAIGIHWYTDFITHVNDLQKTHDAFPDKFLIYTEASAGFKPWDRGLKYGSWERGEEYMHSIISTVNHWVTSWTDWNIALDLGGGPNWHSNNNNVDSPIIVNASADEFYKQPLFYALAHVSKFIEPGALRIDIQPQQSGNIEAMAVQNPDRNVVIVFYNKGTDMQNVILEDLNSGGCIKIQFPKKSFATLIYWP